ncbi:peptidylprolyl isomerase [Luteimonas sp. RD2P54]|uniref:Peptidyl-prolyl cis-trans isomerase n=1 Tax=Luteimonas endophytica TaxID=3042023 RepID=A0ABT6JAU1_9GAMM|nr:peptidylprolyl isomerase [Luteimonas endophytica]MDH5823926.1 peptidylprolyl isomerase [Luteimonas endophytica]
MEIAAERVATIHYTLTDESGQVIDRSPESQPLSYLHGAGNIVPGLEKALDGKKPGDALEVDVKPEEAYGPRNEALVQAVPRDAFKGVDAVEPGMQFKAQTERGPLLVTVVEVGEAQVKIDGNHPLAGRNLHFDVKIADVREASPEEKQVGRVDVPSTAA